MHMHKVPKLALGIGGILFVLGWATVVGGGLMADLDTPPSSEDWSGTLMFEGSTPTTFESEFKWSTTYNIFVQDGSNVTIEILNSDADDILWPCELDDDCDLYDVDGHINGYHYIGDLDFEEYLEESTGIYNPFTKSGTYEISFTEENGETVNVMIREDTSDAGILVAIGGVISCFAGIIILIIGGILSKVMKENPKVELTSTVNDESDD